MEKSPSRKNVDSWLLENFSFTLLGGDKATVNCSLEIPSSYPELAGDEHQEKIEVLIAQVIRGMGYPADKPVFTWGTKIYVKEELFLL